MRCSGPRRTSARPRSATSKSFFLRLPRRCVCVYVSVFVCVCTRTHARTCVCVCVCVGVSRCASVYICIFLYICTYTQTHLRKVKHTSIRTCIRIYTHTNMYAGVWCGVRGVLHLLQAAMQDKLKKLQQEKLSAEELLEAERQEHEEEERAREAAKKRENARLLQEQRDRERALAEERAAEEENAVHRVRSAGLAAVADEEEEGQANEATPSPTPSPSPPPSPDISASAQQDQSVAAQDSKDLALLGEGQRDIRQFMSFLVDMVEERELGVEGVVALWLEQTVAAACRRAEGRELGANVNVQEQSIAEVVAWLVGEVEAQAQAETETGNVAVDADAGAGAREGAIAEVVAWIVGEVEAQVTDTRDDDAGKEEREKVIMEVVSWMVGEVAARVQETVVDTRGDDVGKEEREKIVREVVSWLVGRVEAQVEDAHEAQVEEEQVGSRPSEEAAESRPKGSWSFPEKRYSGRATFKFGVTFKDLTVNVGSKEEGMAQLQVCR